MPPTVLTAVLQTLVLAAAAIAGARSGWNPASTGLLLFGVANIVLVVPGTAWTRTIAIGAVVFALASQHGAAHAIVGLLGWLAWPPALLMGAALAHERRLRAHAVDEVERAGARARAALTAIIAAVAIGSLAFRVIAGTPIQQTAALFVGLPAVMAIAVVYLVSPRTAVGVACKAVTIALLISLLFLGEGLLCVVMSAPIFYLVAIVVGAAIERIRRSGDRPTQLTLSCFAVVVLAPMTLEGVADPLSWNRDETVAVTKVVDASANDVRLALLAAPRFERPLPLYLRAGFPRPVHSAIERGDGRTFWRIHLRGGEMRIDGQEPAPGTLVLELEQMQGTLIRWRAIADDSHMRHFLQWRESIVEWEPVDAGRTRVTWTLRYRRGLDPAWYFGPWERHAARLAAEFLIDAAATP